MEKTSLDRMLAVVDLFQEERLEWTPTEMMGALGYSQSTLYRYIKILANHGFLTSLPQGGYTLGPKIIELDYYLRRSDPLILAGRPLLLELAARYPGTALLVRRFRKSLICVHFEKSKFETRSSYARGRPMPLIPGANAKAILAHLPPRQLRPIYDQHRRAFDEAGLGATLAEVRRNLKTIRNQGYAIGHGEITPGVYGIAAPVFDGSSTVIASLSLTLEDRRLSPGDMPKISEHVRYSASILSTTLSLRHEDVPLDPGILNAARI